MKARYTEPADMILRLRTALECADRKLELVLATNRTKEHGYAGSVCLAARRVIRAGLRECGFEPDSDPESENLTKTNHIELKKWKKI